MDPRIPSKTEEEVIREQDGQTGQVVKKTTTTAPGQQAQDMSTTTHSPTGESVKRTRTVGASPAAARDYGRNKNLYYAFQAIWYVTVFIEIVLAFRFVLKLLGANMTSGFGMLVENLSLPFAGPFASLFQPAVANGDRTVSVVEWSTLIAGFVYVLLALGIVKIFKLGKPVSQEEVEQGVQQQ